MWKRLTVPAHTKRLNTLRERPAPSRPASQHAIYQMPAHSRRVVGRSSQIAAYSCFDEWIGARRHGWELRFAQKFGVIYAAMKIGIDAGILPWPKSFPLRVATKCYRKARHAAKTAYERTADAAAQLERLIAQPGRMVDRPSGRRRIKPIKITDRTCVESSGAAERA